LSHNRFRERAPKSCESSWYIPASRSPVTRDGIIAAATDLEYAATMVLDAIEMARWSRGKTLAGLRCHCDAGSQFTSNRYGERLAEIGAVTSIGTVGDSFDNALAETVNGYYKSELIYGPVRTRPWKTTEDVELATQLGGVDGLGE
jgi:transposase InsO family protein